MRSGPVVCTRAHGGGTVAARLRSTARTRATSARGEKGLGTKSSAPASSDATQSTSSSRLVSTMTAGRASLAAPLAQQRVAAAVGQAADRGSRGRTPRAARAPPRSCQPPGRACRRARARRPRPPRSPRRPRRPRPGGYRSPAQSMPLRPPLVSTPNLLPLFHGPPRTGATSFAGGTHLVQTTVTDAPRFPDLHPAPAPPPLEPRPRASGSAPAALLPRGRSDGSGPPVRPRGPRRASGCSSPSRSPPCSASRSGCARGALDRAGRARGARGDRRRWRSSPCRRSPSSCRSPTRRSTHGPRARDDARGGQGGPAPRRPRPGGRALRRDRRGRRSRSRSPASARCSSPARSPRARSRATCARSSPPRPARTRALLAARDARLPPLRRRARRARLVARPAHAHGGPS